MAGKIVCFQILDLLHAERAFDQYDGRNVEKLEIAGKENDSGGVAIAPFDTGFTGAGEHGRRSSIRYRISPTRYQHRASAISDNRSLIPRHLGPIRSAPSSRTTSPLR